MKNFEKTISQIQWHNHCNLISTYFQKKYKIAFLVLFSFLFFSVHAQQQLQLSNFNNPTIVNGSTVATQSAILSLKNTAGAFSAYTPAIQVNIAISNQQYNALPAGITGTNTATSFGSTINNFGFNALSVPTFNSMNATSNPVNNSFSTSPNLALNTGIDVADNKAFYIYNTVNHLFLANEPTNGRYFFADITISFSKPVSNPVLQIVGLGGNILFSTTNIQGFSTDLELQNTGYLLTRLSGTTELSVVGNKISNANTTFGFNSGNGAASGSVLVEGTNITSLTFKTYVKGDNNGTDWSHSSVNSGDEFLIGVSLDKPINISGNVFNDNNGLVDNTVNGVGTNAGSLLFVNLIDTAGKVVAAIPVAADGSYLFEAVGKGNYTIVLSSIQGIQGANAPLPILPGTWFNTGENVGNLAGNDGTVNGKIDVVANLIDISSVNFGIAQCNSITNPSPNQTICSGVAGTAITVNTLLNNNIRFVKFTASQMAGMLPTTTEWNNILNSANFVNVLPQGTAFPYTATYNFNLADFPNTTNAPITYYVYAINDVSIDTICRPYQLITITVLPKPILAGITGSSTVCVGSVITLSNTTASGIWSSSNTAIVAIANNGVLIGLTPGTATIKYLVTNSNGCKDSVMQLVTAVSPAITPTITASGATTACLGGGFTLTSSTSASYQWFKDGVAIIGATSQTYVPTASGSYTMVIIAGGGACNAISNVINVNINFAATPSISPAGDTVVICTRANEKICPTIWGYSNYQWYKDGVAIAAPLGTASCFVPTEAGRYTLTAQDGNGCWSQPSAASNIKIDTTCTGNVTGGNGGGVENKPLGDVMAQRLYGKAINNIASDYIYTSSFTKSNSIDVNGGAGNLLLSNLLPLSTTNTNKTYISTPSDLVNFTNAIDIFSVDYLQNTNIRAVALVTKTYGEVYSHTKVICDRLKEAELLEVKKVKIRGFDLIASKLKQHGGEVEYVVNFSIGLNKNRTSFGLQSNWLTDNYVKEDTMYNFQLWGASYNTTIKLANDILAKLDSVKAIAVLPNNINDLPLSYVSKGVRNRENMELSIYNPSATTNMQLQFVEKKNEFTAAIRSSKNYTIAAFGTSKITIPVADFYEHNVYMYLGSKLVDLVYISDGSWTADYDKNVTTLNRFKVTNEATVNTNPLEYPLFRNIDIEANSKQNVSAYKLLKGSGLSKDLSEFKSIKLSAAAKGTTTLKITIIKRGINNWNDQYSYKLSVTDVVKEYAIGLDKFTSAASATPLNVNDVTAVVFTWENNRGVSTIIGGQLNKVRFSKNDITFEQAIQNKEISIYPNPNNGKFNVSFMAVEDGPLVLKIIDVAKGIIVDTKFINAKKGANAVSVVTNLNSANLTAYYLLLEGDGVKYVPKKILINK